METLEAPALTAPSDRTIMDIHLTPEQYAAAIQHFQSQQAIRAPPSIGRLTVSSTPASGGMEAAIRLADNAMAHHPATPSITAMQPFHLATANTRNSAANHNRTLMAQNHRAPTPPVGRNGRKPTVGPLYDDTAVSPPLKISEGTSMASLPQQIRA